MSSVEILASGRGGRGGEEGGPSPCVKFHLWICERHGGTLKQDSQTPVYNRLIKRSSGKILGQLSLATSARALRQSSLATHPGVPPVTPAFRKNPLVDTALPGNLVESIVNGFRQCGCHSPGTNPHKVSGTMYWLMVGDAGKAGSRVEGRKDTKGATAGPGARLSEFPLDTVRLTAACSLSCQ